jgi:hypothetical protein
MRKLIFILLLFSLRLSAQYPAYYFFNDTVLDAMGNHNGTGHGVVYTGGIRSDAVYFNRAGAYVATANNINISGNVVLTIACWVKIPDLSHSYTFTLWGTADASSIWFLSGMSAYGDVCINFTGSGFQYAITASAVLTANTWYYVVATKSAGNVTTTTKIYINGVSVPCTFGSTSTPNCTNSTVTIGYDPLISCCANAFAMDELIIDNTTWTATYIKNQYSKYKGFYQ